MADPGRVAAFPRTGWENSIWVGGPDWDPVSAPF